jgi:5-dehydro-2-deoxygluconokinase
VLSVLERERFGVELLTVGRVNLDLYAQQIGVEFPEVAGFDAMVGGSPVNVAIAASRLGISAGVFTAVGVDPVGDWVLRALHREHVSTGLVSRKLDAHTSLALLAQRPPDYRLAFYRHNPADIHLTLAEAAAIPLEGTQALLVSADALARGSTPAAAASLLRRARALEKTVYVDLDLRPVNWSDRASYASEVERVIDEADVVLGTEDEFAALLRLGADFEPDALAGPVGKLASSHADRVIVLKRGDRGATILTDGEAIHVRPFTVSEANTVGAGDSFAAGLIYGRLNGFEWHAAGQFAAACAAITVSRFGCSSGFPRIDEVSDFVAQQTLVPKATR